MEASHELILLGAGLVLVSILLGMVSARFGTPVLLVFLGLGMLVGEDGPGGIAFDDFPAAYLIGSIALAVILFEGGLRTEAVALRRALWPSLALATAGVAGTAALVGLAAATLFGIPWGEGLLIGAILAPTDAAAVSSLLHLRRLDLRARVAATLEIESGLNDPMSVLLTLALVQLVMAPADISTGRLAELALRETIGGLVLGAAGGAALLTAINRLALASGLYPILALAGGLAIFGGAQAVGASGFLAVYLAGLVVGNVRHRATQVINQSVDAFAWLSQIVLFLMLGLLVTPSQLVPALGPALVLALLLILAGRPLATLLVLLPFGFERREIAFIAWVGLRGAVPIFLAIIPMLVGVPDAPRIFAAAFVAVMVSLVVQGWTVAPLARWLGLDVPAQEPGSRLDVDLPPQLAADRAVAGYRLEPRSPAIGLPPEALPLPPEARLLLTIRDGHARSGSGQPPLAVGDYILAMAAPGDLPALDRLFAPRPDRSGARSRGLLGDFSFDAATPVAAIARAYDPAAIPDGGQTAGEFLGRKLRNPAVGDRARLGAVALVVEEVADGRITRVGLDAEPAAGDPFGAAARRLRTLYERWRRRR